MLNVSVYFVKGLRFSGVNETEYRVYLLGNPVGSLHLLHFPVAVVVYVTG